MKITLQSIQARYGEVTAVSDLDLTIGDGELFCLIGPSGCGKTTTLRMIAGLLDPTAGRILFGDEIIADPAARRIVPTAERQLGMVFQSYALWPHLTVADNLALGLKARKLPAADIGQRIEATLALVGLAGRGARYPHELSGGQQQRVALARAIVLRPRVLLFDEPLSNLDASLREQMRDEIRSLQRQIGITAVYVTHDRSEALAISDRVGVMLQGRLVQCDTAETLYRKPVNAFVAGFLGHANLLEGRIENGQVMVGSACLAATARSDTPAVTLMIRPEMIELGAAKAGFSGLIEGSTFLGGTIDYVVAVREFGTRVRVQESGGAAMRRHGPQTVSIPEEAVVLMP